jgi:hypothetical protein
MHPIWDDEAVMYRYEMKLIFFLLAWIPSLASAAWCEVSDFTVDAYDHGGTFIKGTLSRYDGPSLTNPAYEKNVYYLVLNGTTEGATNRRVSIALAAQMSGKNLEVYFKDTATCADFTDYKTATTIRIKI